MMPLLIKLGAGMVRIQFRPSAYAENAEKSGGAALRQWSGLRLL